MTCELTVCVQLAPNVCDGPPCCESKGGKEPGKLKKSGDSEKSSRMYRAVNISFSDALKSTRIHSCRSFDFVPTPDRCTLPISTAGRGFPVTGSGPSAIVLKVPPGPDGAVPTRPPSESSRYCTLACPLALSVG